ncbi:unnamed protein product [Soboliphyme baturini]|uniref:Lipase n=1 Tax=Soboliphyme baturini TaxID=241478 RepID=A0A183IV23_9BILA|nr:unnamed protein product [Soboliphyme baturini]
MFTFYGFASLIFVGVYTEGITARDPEILMNCSQLIGYWEYPMEEHRVVTEDGYILKIYRIPHGHSRNVMYDFTPKPVVFIQHGLLSSCADWISNLRNESLAFVFADAGFDVWLGNFRGNTYGREHIRLNTTSHEFWQFSWDQMAEYDLPAMVNMALNVSGAEHLYYIGHSEGAMTVFAKLSNDQEFAKKLKLVFALGPVTTVAHIKGVLSFLAKLTPQIAKITELFGIDEFLPDNKFVDFMKELFCKKHVAVELCKNILFLIAGPDSHQLNTTRVPVYISHTSAGTSVRNIVHFAQLARNGHYEMYDYGSAAKNIFYYGQATPPVYDVRNITVPVSLFWGAEDWLADPQDVVDGLLSKLKTVTSHFLKGFNHLDFLWGLRATKMVYDVIRDEIYKDLVIDNLKS